MNTLSDETITISEELLKRDTLSKTSLIIYGLITKLATDSKCTISNKSLGNRLNLTNKTISRCLASLENEGLIRREVVRNSDKAVIARNIYII